MNSSGSYCNDFHSMAVILKTAEYETLPLGYYCSNSISWLFEK